MSNLNNDSVEQVKTNKAVKPLNRIDKFFGITARGSTIKAEIIAGIVTFLAMCYILTVNPNQFFWGGIMVKNPDFGIVKDAAEFIPNYTPTSNPLWTSVFIATAFGAIVGTLLMAFLAKLPLAQAPGMGLNSMVGSVIGGGVGLVSYHFSFSLANAMFMVLISGLLFLLLSIISIKGVSLRQKIFEGIPAGIRTAIPVGIGLFIAFIGFQNAKVIVANQYTLVDLIGFSGYGFNVANACVCLFGLVVIAVLDKLKVKGSVIIGIFAATLFGLIPGIDVTKISIITGSEPGISWKFWDNFSNYFSNNGVFGLAVTEGWKLPAGSIMTVIMLIITFCMIDMFDTMGTCVGCCSAAGLLDEKGVPLNYDKIMLSDSIATFTGAIFGTSTVTTFVESGAGIATGGKTGLTALTTAIMFFLAIFALPVFAMIPSAAAASALVYVGVLMMKNIKNIDFSDIKVVVPAFLAIAVMPLGYSITKGIGMAILSYVVISIFCYVGELVKYSCSKSDTKVKPKFDISIVTLIIAALFIVYFFVPTVL